MPDRARGVLRCTGEKWTLMKNISVTEYLNYEGTQFSKSRGVGVFGNDAQETGIPVEVCLSLSAACLSAIAFRHLPLAFQVAAYCCHLLSGACLSTVAFSCSP